MTDHQGKPLYRYLVYRTKEARTYLCVAAARSETHALKIARQVHRLSRSAYALLETVERAAL